MMRPIHTALLSLSMLAVAAPADATCVADGTTAAVAAVQFIPPEDATIVGFGKEHDVLSDDNLGAARITIGQTGVATAKLSVTNKGGDLSGPNGKVQNGFTEGECIEVYLVVSIGQLISNASSISVAGVEVENTMTTEGVSTIETDPVEVCPC